MHFTGPLVGLLTIWTVAVMPPGHGCHDTFSTLPKVQGDLVRTTNPERDVSAFRGFLDVRARPPSTGMTSAAVR